MRCCMNNCSPMRGLGCNVPSIHLLILALYILFAYLLGFPTYFLLFFIFWATVLRRPFVKRSPYAIGPLSCLYVCLSVCLSVCLTVTLVYCGQTVGRIMLKLGMQVGLSPGHIVLDRDPAPPPLKGAEPPIFGRYLLRPNGCMDYMCVLKILFVSLV